MIFSWKKNKDKENEHQQVNFPVEPVDAAPREEPPIWMRTLRINDCSFISRETQHLKLEKADGRFLFEGEWINFRELPLSFEEEINDSISYFRDKKDGERVLAVYEDVPIFDSGDSMYDSIHKAYFKCIGNELTALYIRNGYYLSDASIYRDLHPENEKAEGLLRDAGFLKD